MKRDSSNEKWETAKLAVKDLSGELKAAQVKIQTLKEAAAEHVSDKALSAELSAKIVSQANCPRPAPPIVTPVPPPAPVVPSQEGENPGDKESDGIANEGEGMRTWSQMCTLCPATALRLVGILCELHILSRETVLSLRRVSLALSCQTHAPWAAV